MLARCVCFACAFVLRASARELATFDSAGATSVYGSSNDAFAPSKALADGSGYWCSAGGHGNIQDVSWTGRLTVPHKAYGVSLHWAYSPHELKILVSADGINFAEAVCWQRATQEDASYIEHVMFQHPMDVQAVAVVVRGARAWGYFGLNAAALLSEDGPSMVVSGGTSPGGEACLTVEDGSIALKQCIEVIAAGSSGGVFQFTETGLLKSMSEEGSCVALLDGDATSGKFVTAPCASIRNAEDGRGVFALTPSGQMRVGYGNSCMVARGPLLSVLDCVEAAGVTDAGDKFFTVAMPEVNVAAAKGAHATAALALKTASRLSGTVNELRSVLPLLDDCSSGIPANVTLPTNNLQAVSAMWHSPTNAAEAVVLELGVAGLPQLVEDARNSILAVRKKL